MATLTHHKKSVRAMALHPSDFASASADNVKKFNLPKGEFLHSMLLQQKTIIKAMAVNADGVLATGGSLHREAGIYALSYDTTGSRLVSCEANKTIRIELLPKLMLRRSSHQRICGDSKVANFLSQVFHPTCRN